MYLVKDNEFNRHWYPELIGLKFDSPPSYAIVEIVHDETETKERENNETNNNT